MALRILNARANTSLIVATLALFALTSTTAVADEYPENQVEVVATALVTPDVLIEVEPQASPMFCAYAPPVVDWTPAFDERLILYELSLRVNWRALRAKHIRPQITPRPRRLADDEPPAVLI